MPLLVVCLSAAEADALSLGEYRALLQRERVEFEDPRHPLLSMLSVAGVHCEPSTAEPDPTWDDVALVADSYSPRIADLANKGAEVSVGAAQFPDPLTAARVAPFARRLQSSMLSVAGIMARLRGDDGCPWDAKQTHESLRIHLIEETYEVLEAIDQGLTGDELEEELGDVLLQVAFHSELARQDGRFDLASVADELVAKLVYRHPHVFGDTKVSGADEVLSNWETLKKAEKKRESVYSDIPAGLPALLAAYKTFKRSLSLGFQPTEEDARAGVIEALGSAGEDGVGEALLWVVALARARGVDPESALRTSLARFQQARVSSTPNTAEEAP